MTKPFSEVFLELIFYESLAPSQYPKLKNSVRRKTGKFRLYDLNKTMIYK